MKFNLRLPDNEKSWLLEHAQARNITPTAVLREYIRTLPQRTSDPLAPQATPLSPLDTEAIALEAVAVLATKGLTNGNADVIAGYIRQAIDAHVNARTQR